MMQNDVCSLVIENEISKDSSNAIQTGMNFIKIHQLNNQFKDCGNMLKRLGQFYNKMVLIGLV